MDRSWEYINRSQTHNVEIGAEAAQFPEKKYINGIAVAMYKTGVVALAQQLQPVELEANLSLLLLQGQHGWIPLYNTLKSLRGSRLHKTTYAPVPYTSLYIMFLMRANLLLGQVGGGWALEISTFLGPPLSPPPRTGGGGALACG